ncbi:MAG TPA: gamma-glutamylcyclotransferase family protein [Rubrobacteraceae bacterium]|nr:gamma-glutamylcyclotransferase family protein [Rubrobacteraceae bacterium]
MKPMQLNIFVYGTLKRGQRNHERFCQDLNKAQKATVRGWLYELPYGFPALIVPEANVLARGTANYLTDITTQNHTQAGLQGSPLGWDTIYGELFTFDDPEERLLAFDDLEGFHPGERSLYERVLVPTTLSETKTTLPAWVYVAESPSGIYLPRGRWPAP